MCVSISSQTRWVAHVSSVWRTHSPWTWTTQTAAQTASASVGPSPVSRPDMSGSRWVGGGVCWLDLVDCSMGYYCLAFLNRFCGSELSIRLLFAWCLNWHSFLQIFCICLKIQVINTKFLNVFCRAISKTKMISMCFHRRQGWMTSV